MDEPHLIPVGFWSPIGYLPVPFTEWCEMQRAEAAKQLAEPMATIIARKQRMLVWVQQARWATQNMRWVSPLRLNVTYLWCLFWLERMAKVRDVLRRCRNRWRAILNRKYPAPRKPVSLLGSGDDEHYFFREREAIEQMNEIEAKDGWSSEQFWRYVYGPAMHLKGKKNHFMHIYLTEIGAR